MKLISLNVALFESNNDRVGEFLATQKPDIICIQEAVQKEDPGVDPQYVSMDHIAKATPELKYSYFSPNWFIKDFHMKNFHQRKSFDFEFGGFLKTGGLVRSRYKMLKKIDLPVGNSDFAGKKITDWSDWPEKQSKLVQAVDLELPWGKKIRVINYHGIWSREKIGNRLTLAACQKIARLAKEVDFPVIITGDFNLFPDTKSMKVFKDFRSLVDEQNIKTTRPNSNELSHLERNVVDYILVSTGIRVNSFEVPDIDISDHLPLILDFEI